MAEQMNVSGIVCQPGIFRDWTDKSSAGWIDGQYTRFMEGRPKKMGGWQLIGTLGLTTNNTAYLNVAYTTLADSGITSTQFVGVGTIRTIKTFPVDGRYIVIAAADITNITVGGWAASTNKQIVPSGLWIAETDDFFDAALIFNPISFAPYPLFEDDGVTPTGTYQYFTPGAYNWSVEIYGVTSGGTNAFFTVGDPTGGGGAMSSLALVAHAAKTLEDKNSSYNNYVYFSLLSNLIDRDNPLNYSYDPLVEMSNYTAPAGAPFGDPRWLFTPVMYPMTQYPQGGITTTAHNQYVLPTATNTAAIYCTSEVIVSGGVVAAGSFLFAYGNNGLIRNCNPNAPAYWANAANVYYQYQLGLANDNNIDNYKVLAVRLVRSGAGLSVLAWTTNSLWLITASNDPNAAFSYTNISNSCSLVSANSIIENAGIWYWIGEDKFYMYNGSLLQLPNPVNFTWFYANLNFAQRSKIFAYKNSHFNEITWGFPIGQSTECNHAIIFNYTENTWFDTPWIRTAGYYDYSYYRPIAAGDQVEVPVGWDYAYTLTEYNSTTWLDFKPTTYLSQAIWFHEVGDNQVAYNGLTTAIDANIMSCDLGLLSGGPQGQATNPVGMWNYTKLDKFLPDFIGTGTQYFQVYTKQYPNDDVLVEAFSCLYDETDVNGVDISLLNYQSVNIQGRLIFVKFGCNALNGTFFLGEPMVITYLGHKQ